jgi:hypothetical protein
MQIEVVSGTEERLAITALCLDTETLAKIASTLPENPFPSKWSNIVVKWCINHFNQFGQAPGGLTLTAIYAEWANSADDTSKELVGKFLGSLSPIDINSDYLIELIERLVTRTAAKQLVDKAQNALSNGQLRAATDLIQGWKPPQISQDADFVSPILNPSVIGEAFDKAHYAPLITFPAGTPLAAWFGPTLHRDALVVFCGPDKAGKSSHLASLCQRAVIQGQRVAYFNIGDLSQEQALTRWSTAFVGRPKFACVFKKPISIEYKEKEFFLKYSEHPASRGYSRVEAETAWARLAEQGEADRLRFSSYPANTVTVEGIQSTLAAWANKGWVPDVVGLDYAALLAPSKATAERHESLDHIWKTLRQISQEMKCLLLTAAQTNADAYKVETYWIRKNHFSGSKGIWAHCNAAIGINVTEQEKTQQVTRFNYIALREREYLSNVKSEYIAVAGCPSIGRFHLISEFI